MGKKQFGNVNPEADYWKAGGASEYASSSKSGGSVFSHKPCYHTHPELKFIAKDGKEYGIFGGNCSTPIVKDADIYIGFAGSVKSGQYAYPWEAAYKQQTIVDFYITDMSVPKILSDFQALVDWTELQLIAGKKIHAGCIGGHGRTGTFFAALVAQMTGMEDSITYVREKYCKKAVESDEQINWLNKHYGCTVVKANKEHFLSSKGKGTKSDVPYWDQTMGKSNGYQGSSGSSKKASTVSFLNSKRDIAPMSSDTLIW